MNSQAVIIGRTNVGKSLLFNKLTKQKKSLVIDYHGVTKDINHGYLKTDKDNAIKIFDTSGFTEALSENDEIYTRTVKCIKKSQLIIYILSLDALTSSVDYDLIKKIRKFNTKIFLVLNKIDLKKKNQQSFDIYQYGIDDIYQISAKNNIGLDDLKNAIIKSVQGTAIDNDIYRSLSIVGKPNTGKSTLINALLRTDKMLTSNEPGTTIDCIDNIIKYKNKKFLITDTAGLARKSKNRTKLNSYSMLNTMNSIKQTDLSLLVINSEEMISKQDKTVLEFLRKSNKPHILVVNKIDLLTKRQISELMTKIDYFTNISSNANSIYISALEKKNISNLKRLIFNISTKIGKRYKSSLLTKILNDATDAHPLPLVNKRRIKLKFAQQGKSQDLTIIIHGNKVTKIPDSYNKYLINYFMNKLSIKGLPIKLVYGKEKNPFIKI